MKEIKLEVRKTCGSNKFITLKGEPTVLRLIAKRLRRGGHLNIPKIGKVRRVKK
ncbi:hypothetical protein KKH36_00505 [Patescibacteria group bacterium]|nr:hypothetical protein [Patescibacteria group bacterium]